MAKFYNSPGRSRLESTSKEIMKRIHEHDPAYGGHFIECTAGTGKGKTALLLSSALYNLESHPKEKVFFSECFNTGLQTLKLGKEKVLFLLPKDDKYIRFRNRNNGQPLEPNVLNIEEYELPKATFMKIPSGNFDENGIEQINEEKRYMFSDLYEKAKLGMINVPIFPNRIMMIDFLTYLRDNIHDFVLVLIDEMSEVCPALQSDVDWRNVGKFAAVCKDFRKNKINVWYTAQACTQVDWRVRAAVDIKIFGPASKVDNINPVWQKSIHGLEVNRVKGNQFYIVDGGEFGMFRLTDIFEPIEGQNYEIYREGVS